MSSPGSPPDGERTVPARVDTLGRLQRWFAAHCDGSREHRYGIRIETCDNPG